MFEMKNENDQTATKKKNEDFLKELDKDRNEKQCEYAILVSLLEPDSELYEIRFRRKILFHSFFAERCILHKYGGNWTSLLLNLVLAVGFIMVVFNHVYSQSLANSIE